MSFLAKILFVVVRAIIEVYSVITYPIYALIDRPWSRPDPQETKAKVVDKTKTSITVRSVDIKCEPRDEILQHSPPVETMATLFEFMVTKYGNRMAVGQREQIREEKIDVDNGAKILTKLIQGEYEWKRYKEVLEDADHFGKGLRELGVEPRERIGIFADTRQEWLIAATGCWRNSIALATVYTNLGAEGIIHGMNQTQVSTVITSSGDLLNKLIKVLPELPNVKRIIFFENPIRPMTPPSLDNIELYSYSKVLEIGLKSTISPEMPTKHDVAIVMYTSGSTGVPKGVILTHENMIAGVLAILPLANKAILGTRTVTQEDSYIAFLPLAHVLEMLAEHVMLLIGVKLGYSSPGTLTDKSAMVKPGDLGDASELKPSVMASVPLVLGRIYKRIQSNIAQKSAFAQLLVAYLFKYKIKWSNRGFGTPIANKLVFSKMKSVIGGRLLVMLSGGAPLSDEEHEYIRAAIDCTLLQGYGLTETSSTATISDPSDPTTGHVGAPLPGVEIRLEDWTEGGYTVNDEIGPRGEIIIGGPHISQGYFNMPQKTEEEFFMDPKTGIRFFKTGDIGQLRKDGSLKIIDRKKDLVKLQGGEYVSLGKVEASLKSHTFVENICVYADPRKSATVALVVPDETQLKQVAKINGDKSELCKNPSVIKSYLDALRSQGISAKLEKWEIPKQIVLVDEDWSPESGLVTAAFKLRRKPIQDKYQDELDAMYQQIEGASIVQMKIVDEKKKKKNDKNNNNDNNNNTEEIVLKVQSAKKTQVSPA